MKKTFMIREDLSDRLIHLTRGEKHQEDRQQVETAASTLVEILNEKRLLGGNGGIKGGHCCICFSEAPISKLAYILANKSILGMRYQPFGIMVEKTWLFEKGGRPVIYQPEAEYDLLHEKQKFRHATYELLGDNIRDYSWEREWRIQTGELPIDPDSTTIVVPNREWEKYIIENYKVTKIPFDHWITDRIPLDTHEQKPVWHLLVLEDLGIPIPSVDPPVFNK